MRTRWFAVVRCAVVAVALSAPGTTRAASPVRHNVILFVAGGLRGVMVDKNNAPAMDALRRAGVAFPNSHAIVPTTDLANAAGEATILAAANEAGYETASIGDATGSMAAALRQATTAVLPAFKASGKPFVLTFRSRDPAATQQVQADSVGRLTPGIDGPTSLAALRNADDELRALRAAVHELGLDATTDVIVTSDHGASTISKTSKTSPSTRYQLTGIPSGALPPGFLALDLASALELPLRDPDNGDGVVQPDLEHTYPTHGNGLIGDDAAHPQVVVAAGGGSDLIYLPQPDAAELASRIVAFLLTQDYVSALFVDSRLGRFGGTLPLTSIGLDGIAAATRPAMVVGFTSFDTGCGVPRRCAADVADTTLQQGQGTQGSFGAADVGNFTAAFGPDFKRHFVDAAPVSNADVGVTIARVLGLQLSGTGRLTGRAFTEATPGGAPPAVSRSEEWSAPGPDGSATVLRYQTADGVRYIDVAGRLRRTAGL